MATSQVTQAKAERVYVIGDIHGCVEEPEILITYLEENENITENDLIVFLGDYIDRGKTTRQVIDLMLEVKSRFPATRFLKGNHEDMLLDFLGFSGNLGESFLYNGGVETLQSYGISVFAPPQEIVNTLPPEHFKFFCELESILYIPDDKFVCVHAGLHPLRDLNSQTDDEVLWIRQEFLRNIHAFPFTVIFGHTPHKDVFFHMPYKIGIDTGLVFGNKLSCYEITTGTIFQIARGSKQVAVRKVEENP